MPEGSTHTTEGLNGAPLPPTLSPGVAKKMRPIGAWIADKDVGTVMGRRLGMDRRHLGDRAADAPPKAYVPGWVGVRTESGKPWTPAYAGAYIPSLYETTMATVLPMKCLEVDTPEEAVSAEATGAGTGRCLPDCLPADARLYGLLVAPQSACGGAASFHQIPQSSSPPGRLASALAPEGLTSPLALLLLPPPCRPGTTTGWPSTTAARPPPTPTTRWMRSCSGRWAPGCAAAGGCGSNTNSKLT